MRAHHGAMGTAVDAQDGPVVTRFLVRLQDCGLTIYRGCSHTVAKACYKI
jgi:hypothetical protein